GQDQPASPAPKPTDLEEGASGVPVQAQVGQPCAARLVCQVQCGEDHNGAHGAGSFPFGETIGRIIGGYSPSRGPALNSRAGRPVAALRAEPAGMMNPSVL